MSWVGGFACGCQSVAQISPPCAFLASIIATAATTKAVCEIDACFGHKIIAKHKLRAVQTAVI